MDGRIILKQILNKLCRMIWNALIWPIQWICCGILWTQKWAFVSHKKWKNYVSNYQTLKKDSVLWSMYVLYRVAFFKYDFKMLVVLYGVGKALPLRWKSRNRNNKTLNLVRRKAVGELISLHFPRRNDKHGAHAVSKNHSTRGE